MASLVLMQPVPWGLTSPRIEALPREFRTIGTGLKLELLQSITTATYMSEVTARDTSACVLSRGERPPIVGGMTELQSPPVVWCNRAGFRQHTGSTGTYPILKEMGEFRF